MVKKDATTGKVIPAAGIGFKIRDLQSGEFITQRINYPTPVDIDVFYTDNTDACACLSRLVTANMS